MDLIDQAVFLEANATSFGWGPQVSLPFGPALLQLARANREAGVALLEMTTSACGGHVCPSKTVRSLCLTDAIKLGWSRANAHVARSAKRIASVLTRAGALASMVAAVSQLQVSELHYRGHTGACLSALRSRRYNCKCECELRRAPKIRKRIFATKCPKEKHANEALRINSIAIAKGFANEMAKFSFLPWKFLANGRLRQNSRAIANSMAWSTQVRAMC